MVKATNKQCDKAQELLKEFLEGMTELRVNEDTQKIVDDCYDGDVGKYILESFGNFLDQVID